jgi:FkbM family methyltransferase
LGAKARLYSNSLSIKLGIVTESNRPYYWREINFFRAFKDCGFEPKAIFDIGSSHAGWSWEVSSVFPEAAFHLFEPLVDYKPSYQKGIAGALGERPNLRIHKIAVGSSNGWTPLGTDEAGYSGSTLVTAPSEKYPEMYRVPIRRLDSYVAELGLPSPDVLKIDVQGGEIAVLEGSGSLLQNVQLIQMETWLRRSYDGKAPLLHEIIGYLSRFKLQLVEFGDPFYDELHQICALDAYFAHLSLLDKFGEKLPKTRLTDDRDP